MIKLKAHEKAQHKCVYILVGLWFSHWPPNTIAVQHAPAQPLGQAGLSPGDRAVWLKPRGTLIQTSRDTDSSDVP